MYKSLFIVVTLFLSFTGTSQKTITLTYIGNMGVYISDDKSSVLIDGLHEKYKDDYAFPSKKLVNKINTQLQPDAILFTHTHGDHFSLNLSKKYLLNNSKARLYGPSQITAELESLKNQVYTITTKNYSKQSFRFGTLKITGLKINHAGKKHVTIENVGYIITIGGKKILHVGDTNWMTEIKLFEHLNLIKESIDVAILPYWMLLDPNAKDYIKKYINPKKIIATHISPLMERKELQKIKTHYTNTYFFTEPEMQVQL